MTRQQARAVGRAVRGRYGLCRVAGLTRRVALVRTIDTLVTEGLCEAIVGHDPHWVNGVRQCALCDVPLGPPGQRAGGPA